MFKSLPILKKTVLFAFALLIMLGGVNAHAQSGIALSSQPENVKISANGDSVNAVVVRDEGGSFFLPINRMETGLLLNKFGARVTWLVPMNTVVVGFPGGKDLRFKIGEKTAEYGGKPVQLKSGVRMLGDEPCIPVESLAVIFNLNMALDEKTHIMYLDPIIKDMKLEAYRGVVKFEAKGTAPLKYTTSKLTEPDRFVVDINNAVLDPSLEGKDFRHTLTGSIFVSQDSRTPNRVRVIFPMSSNVEIEMRENKDKKVLGVDLVLPQMVAPVQDMAVERITRFKVKKDDDKVTFYISSTGPIQYEWRRLLPPDNRYFIDIPKAIYTGSYDEKLDVGFISGISVSQISKDPDPAVRVTLKLEVPSKVSVEPDPEHPEIIKVEISKDTINPVVVQRQGFGVTKHVVRGGIVICLDPGHGGGDPGACNGAYGLQEKKITLDICLKLASMLKSAGWNVVMTRTTDRDVSYAGSSDSRELGDRVGVANGVNAQIFVSVHINASTSSSASGSSTHYYKDIDEPLARNIQENLLAAGGRQNNGVQHDSFYVVRNTTMPAALVECAFISNPTEASLLSSDEYRARLARGIFNGIMSYAKSANLKGSVVAEEPEDDGSAKLKEMADQKKRAVEKDLEKGNNEGDPDFGER
ncbi:MAG: N-acetylmuramoyl-L-alanine amidase family protein [Firmicutes bacterium]|nr:N-acetylmuramoyl-L-alanine amidase family protein [Bacillota bacterium]